MPDYDASNRKDIRKAEKALALRVIQDREAVAAIMSTIPGRAWMWRKLGEAHIFVNDFTGDALRDAFSAGERNSGLRLLADIMLHCPDAYLQMTKEANNDRHDSNNGSPAAERRGGSIPDGGDSGQDGGAAEGSELDSAEPGRYTEAGSETGGEVRYHN